MTAGSRSPSLRPPPVTATLCEHLLDYFSCVALSKMVVYGEEREFNEESSEEEEEESDEDEDVEESDEDEDEDEEEESDEEEGTVSGVKIRMGLQIFFPLTAC